MFTLYINTRDSEFTIIIKHYPLCSGTYNTQKAIVCEEAGSGSRLLACVYAKGSWVEGCIFVFRQLYSGQELDSVYVNRSVEHSCEVKSGRYHLKVYDWESDVRWREHGPALDIPLVDIKSEIVFIIFNCYYNYTFCFLLLQCR